MPTDNPIKITPIYCESDTIYDGQGETIVGDLNLSGSNKNDLRPFIIYKDVKNVIIKNYNFVNISVAVSTSNKTSPEFSARNPTLKDYDYPWGGVRNITVTNCTMFNAIGEDPFVNYARQNSKIQGTVTGSAFLFYSVTGTAPVNCSITNNTLTGRCRLLTTGKYSRNWKISDNYTNGGEDTTIYVKGHAHRILRNTVLNSGKDGIKVLQQGTINSSGTEFSIKYNLVEGTEETGTYDLSAPDVGGKNQDQLWWGHTVIADNYSQDYGLIKPDSAGAYLVAAPMCLLENNVGRVTKWGNSGHQKDPDESAHTNSAKSTFEWAPTSCLGISRNNKSETIDPNSDVYRAEFYRGFNVKSPKVRAYERFPREWHPQYTIDRIGDSVVYVEQGKDPSPWDSSAPWVLND